MIINQNGLKYLTSRFRGTIMGIHFKEENGVKIYSFLPGKVGDIRVPEKQEDKKVEMVISAIRELMAEDEFLVVKLYDQIIKFYKNEGRYEMYQKIFKALILSFGAKDENSLKYGVRKILDDALKNGQIDVC